MPEPTRWKQDVIALGASAAAVLVYCFPRLLFLGEIVYCLDAGRMHYPIKVFLGERLRAGELPLWYPYDGLGTPFIANGVTAVFHPLVLWSLTFSPEAALTLSLISCVLVGQCGCYWLARRLGAGPAGAVSAAAALAGFLLSSVQLLPTFSVLHELHRAQGFPYEEAVGWSLPWLRLPELFLGDILRYRPFHLEGGPQLLQLMGYGGKAPWYPNVYLGTLGALGAIWALTLTEGLHRRAAIGLCAVAAILLWLALGRHAGLYALFHRFLPLWNTFRYPEKALNYFATLFAVLAGMGVSAALRSPARAWRSGFLAGGMLLGLSGLSALGREPLGTLALRIAREGDAALPEILGPQYALQLGEVLLRGGLLAATVGGLLFLASRPKPTLVRIIPVVITAAFLIDLGSVNARAVAMCSGDRDSAAGRSLTSEALDALGEKRPGHFRVASYAGYGMAYHPDVGALAGASYQGAAEWDLQSLAADFSAL